MVWPALTYGIWAAGLTRLGAEKIHGVAMRHIRSITGNPVHLTGLTNLDLLRRYKLDPPLTTLLQQSKGRLAKLTSLRAQASSDLLVSVG